MDRGELESLGHDADDRHLLGSESNGTALDPGIPKEASLPQRVADHGNSRRARQLVGVEERSTALGQDSREVLADYGIAPGDIEELIAARVVQFA